MLSIQPPFARQGNKFPIRNKIVPLIPPHKTYVELFAGSAAIFFNKEKAEENVLNDLDKKTANTFRMVKQAPIDPESYPSLPTLVSAKKYFNRPVGTSIQDRMVHHKIASSTGFSNKPVQRAAQIYHTKDIQRWAKGMEVWKDKLKGVTITSLDYEKVIDKYDSDDTFFFLDPPYENTDKHFGYAQDKDSFDFERLLKVLNGIKGNFLMTINDSPHIRKLFKGFNQKPVDVMTSWGTHHAGKHTVRKELFISNYTMAKVRRSDRLAAKA